MSEQRDVGTTCPTFTIRTGVSHRFRAHVLGEVLIRTDVLRAEAEANEEFFTLRCEDPAYEQRLSSVQDDLRLRASVDLLFTDVPRRGLFSLHIEADGVGETIFEGVEYRDLRHLST